MKIELVPVEYVHVVWPDLEKFIKRSMQYSHGEYTLEQARTLTALGAWKLIVASDSGKPSGAMLVQVFNRPNQNVAFIQAVGGRGIISTDTYAQLCALCKAWGATHIECAARPTVQKLLEQVGMAEKYRILGMAL